MNAPDVEHAVAAPAREARELVQTPLCVHLVRLELAHGLPLRRVSHSVATAQERAKGGDAHLHLLDVGLQEAERALPRVEVRLARAHDHDLKELAMACETPRAIASASQRHTRVRTCRQASPSMNRRPASMYWNELLVHRNIFLPLAYACNTRALVSRPRATRRRNERLTYANTLEQRQERLVRLNVPREVARDGFVHVAAHVHVRNGRVDVFDDRDRLVLDVAVEEELHDVGKETRVGDTKEVIERLHVVVAVARRDVTRAVVQRHDLVAREALAAAVHARVAELLVRADLAEQALLAVDREAADRKRRVELEHGDAFRVPQLVDHVVARHGVDEVLELLGVVAERVVVVCVASERRWSGVYDSE